MNRKLNIYLNIRERAIKLHRDRSSVVHRRDLDLLSFIQDALYRADNTGGPGTEQLLQLGGNK